jgi:hypothetical protein
MKQALAKIDPVLILLFLGMWLATATLIGVDILFKSEGQIFQVLSGLVTAFAGAFFARMKPDTKADHPNENPTPVPPPDGTVVPPKA